MKVDKDWPSTYTQVVIDTNVLLSAALAPRSIPATLVDCLVAHHCLVFSPVTFAELETRIWKPKFDRYLSIERRNSLLRELRIVAQWIHIPPSVCELSFSRDKDDDAFIQVAMAANVKRLISGDNDLLCLHPLGTLHIISPRLALEEINHRKTDVL